jgi:YYY domain-containing protein
MIFNEDRLSRIYLKSFLFLILGSLAYLLLGVDILPVIIWWLSLLVIGFIFLPVTAKIFPKFFDKGYLFSKIIGLIFLTFSLWLFSMLKILPFYRVTIFGLLLAAIGIIFIGLKGFRPFKSFLKAKNMGEIFIYEEALFLLGLVFFVFVRGQLPDIHGTEKFMDLAFLNNLLRTKFMPPVDMWFAGKPANYYYYGHYVFAFLTKLTGIRSSLTYNLGMATLFTFGFSLTFSLTANLVYLLGKKGIQTIILAGLISASLLSLGGNLHTFVYAVALPFAKNIGVYHGNVKSYFYADPRSYIGTDPPTNDKLITEYPSYSYILGDLHAQIVDVFFVLTFLGLLLAFLARLIEGMKNKKTPDRWYYMPPEMIMMTLLLTVMWMTNTWDYPIYFIVFVIFLLGISFIKYGFINRELYFTLINSGKVLILSLLLLTPFLINFINPTQGIHFTNLSHLLSPLYLFQMFIVWGYQLFFVILFFIYIFKVEPRHNYQKILAGLKKKPKIQLSLNPKINYKNFCQNFRCTFSKLSVSDLFIFLICICALGLLIGSEVFYQKDVSAIDWYRANTVWKVTLQVFILFDITVGYIAIRIFSINRTKIKQNLLRLITATVIILAMLYPFWAIGQISISKYKGLDGTVYLEQLYFDDYQAILWLRKSVANQPVIVEAVGESYTDFARISANTGLPTILGWRVHEWYWRGSFDEAGKRTEEVKEIYEGNDLAKTRQLLSQYQAQFIFVGSLERQTYLQLKEDKFLKLGKIVFSSNQTKIYQLDF